MSFCYICLSEYMAGVVHVAKDDGSIPFPQSMIYDVKMCMSWAN